MGDHPVIFRDPSFLALGVGLTALLLIGLLGHMGRRRRLAEFLGGRRASQRLARSNLYRVRVERWVLLGLSGVGLAVAAAGPRWTDGPELGPPANEIILAIDVSASMQASDVSPTRLARAVDVAMGLMDDLEEHRVGLLLFAGKGYALAPPTHDHNALRFLLQGVTPTIASALDPGTLVSVGIEEAVGLLEREEDQMAPEDGSSVSPSPTPSAPAVRGNRWIVVIGDGETGESDDRVSEVVAHAREAGIGVHTVGVGTAVGSGMIMPAATYQLGGPVLDANGARGTTHLREPLLRRLAAMGGGEYARADEPAGLASLRAELAEVEVSAELSTDEQLPLWARYDLPFLLGLGALLLVFTESLLDLWIPGYRRTWNGGPI
jgi:Ca-activated chloride channel family protein